jgi:endonuclease/exonuclease/phosphatase (EEP) superfamily protein YafD
VWLCTIVGLFVGALHLVATDAAWALVVANMCLPWIAASVIAATLAAFVGQRGVLILVTIPAAVLVTWPVAAEIWPREPAYGEGTPVRVLTANLFVGNIAQERAIEALLGTNADVICLQEVTYAWARSLDEKSVTESYPHRHFAPEDSPFGIAILSKKPLRRVDEYTLASIPQLRAIIDVDGVDLELHCLHLMPPLTPGLFANHERAHEALVAILDRRGDDAGPIALAGDFNSTPYNVLHRDLVTRLTDAWDAAGDGFGHTAPADSSFIPPMRVDHVYAGGGARPLDADLLPSIGSDHHPLLVYLAVAASPSPVGP